MQKQKRKKHLKKTPITEKKNVKREKNSKYKSAKGKGNSSKTWARNSLPIKHRALFWPESLLPYFVAHNGGLSVVSVAGISEEDLHCSFRVRLGHASIRPTGGGGRRAPRVEGPWPGLRQCAPFLAFLRGVRGREGASL